MKGGTKSLDDAVAEIAAATSKLTGASRKRAATPARAAVLAQLKKVAPLSDVTVHEHGGLLSRACPSRRFATSWARSRRPSSRSDRDGGWPHAGRLGQKASTASNTFEWMRLARGLNCPHVALRVASATRTVLGETMAGQGATNFATKEDVHAVRDELHAVRDELRGEMRGIGVVVERIETQVRALADAVSGTREQLERKMSAMEERLSARITNLEQAVRQNSEDIQHNSEAIRHNSEDIRSLRVEVAELRVRFDKGERYGELDARVTAVEKHLGITRR